MYAREKHTVTFRVVCTVGGVDYVDVLDENGDVMEYGLALPLAQEKYREA